MDINTPISSKSPFAANRAAENTLNLKVGQQLDVKVISADIQAAKNAITLTLGNKDITVQSNQPVTLNPGLDLKLQVTQIAPNVEFKILAAFPEQNDLRLKLMSTARDGGSAASGREPMRPTVRDGESAINGRGLIQPNVKDSGSAASGRGLIQPNASAFPLPPKQLLDAKITGIVGTKIQLQVFANNPGQAKTSTTITIEQAQLSNAPAQLKVGQSLNLEIIKTGTVPEFKIIPGSTIPEATVTEFIKQFLPRHEASPVLLNQLIKDLPQLMKNESVSQTLKDIAANIISNLPPKQQMTSSPGLKQAIADSGTFLEAKLSSAMTQAELIKQSAEPVKKTNLPGIFAGSELPSEAGATWHESLQRIAGDILQNLTQKEPLSSALNPAKPMDTAKIDSAQAEEQRVTDVIEKAKAGDDAEVIAAGNKTLPAAVAEDFKANLLKFIHALKQELLSQSEQPPAQAGLDLLKNLQNKSENTVATIVLDQLMSLPKDDNPKQLWSIDIPFIDRQQAETVKIEIQQDKQSQQHQPGNSDWSVNITVTPPELGTIHCIVSFRNDVINTYFKSRSPQTTELIKHNLDYLKNQLEEAGLTTGHMDAHDGPQNTQSQPQLAGKKLFDEKV